jgi:hypothetical protein
MRISNAFPSTYLKAADLNGRTAKVVMESIRMEDIGSEQKPILYFQGKEKGLVLNKTNANNIAYAYGEETDTWAGRPLELFEAMVDFQGRTVPAIRVRIPRDQDAQQGYGAQQGHQAPAPVPAQQNGNGHPNAPQSHDMALDDEVPF